METPDGRSVTAGTAFADLSKRWLELVWAATPGWGYPALPSVEQARKLRKLWLEGLSRWTDAFLRSPAYLRLMAATLETTNAMTRTMSIMRRR